MSEALNLTNKDRELIHYLIAEGLLEFDPITKNYSINHNSEKLAQIIAGEEEEREEIRDIKNGAVKN